MKKLRSERLNNFLEVAQLAKDRDRAYVGLLAASSELFVVEYRLIFIELCDVPPRKQIPGAL